VSTIPAAAQIHRVLLRRSYSSAYRARTSRPKKKALKESAAGLCKKGLASGELKMHTA
jgi:hypothetical protein